MRCSILSWSRLIWGESPKLQIMLNCLRCNVSAIAIVSCVHVQSVLSIPLGTDEADPTAISGRSSPDVELIAQFHLETELFCISNSYWRCFPLVVS